MKTKTGCGEEQDGLDGFDEGNNETGDGQPDHVHLAQDEKTLRRQCAGQPKLRKRVRSQAGVDESCFCSQLRSKTNNGDTDFNIDRHEKEQLHPRRANRTSFEAKEARTI